MLKEIRQEDVVEVRLFYNGSPEELLEEAVSKSNSIDAILDEEPVVVGGVREEFPGSKTAWIWMIGSPLLNQLKYKKELLKRAKPLINKYLEEYNCLFNYCSNNPSTLRLLTRLGFTIQDLPDPTIKYFYITR